MDFSVFTRFDFMRKTEVFSFTEVSPKNKRCHVCSPELRQNSYFCHKSYNRKNFSQISCNIFKASTV